MIHGGEKSVISIMILVKKTTGANELCLHESILLVSQFFSVVDTVINFHDELILMY